MIKKSTLEKVISEDLAEIWAVLTPEEKRKVVDNFHVQNFKKNQIIYAESEKPEYLWCLLKGKVKMYKDGIKLVENCNQQLDKVENEIIVLNKTEVGSDEF